MELFCMVSALILAQTGPVQAQAEGLRLVARGDLVGAEAAFTRAIALGPNQKPTPTGLEAEFAPSQPLARALRQYRAAFTPEAGIAAAYSNRAAVRLLLRNFTGAFQDNDQAVLRAPDWGTPWTNGALAWLGKGNVAKALSAIKMAIDQGENTAHAYAVLAEIELEAGQLERAREDLKRATDRDGSLPYVLAVRARLLHRQSRVLDGERAFLQGLAQAAMVTTDQFGVNTLKELRTRGGVIEEGLVKARQLGQAGDTLYRVSAGVIRQEVEGRPHAYQGRNEAGFVVGSARSGLAVGSFLDEYGGRPGADSALLATALGYGFQRSALTLQKTTSIAKMGQLTLQGTLRHSNIRIKPLAVTTITDDQMGLETRLLDGPWTVGAAWNQVKRKTDYVASNYVIASPVEPLEQVTPNGITTQGLAYALYKKPLSRFVSLSAGPVLATNNGSKRVQALADLSLRLTDQKTIHVRTTPHLVAAASDLFPAALALSPQNNPVDQDRETVNGFNRDPYLPGTLGRMLSHEVDLGQVLRQGLHLDTRLFRNEIFQYFAHSVDPRLGSLLAVTRATNGPSNARVATLIARAQATGLEQRLRWDATPQTTVSFAVTYQETQASIPLGAQRVLHHLPYIPQWQATSEVDWRVAGWTLSAEGFYLGKRPTAITATDQQIPRTVAGTMKTTAGLNLKAQGAIHSQLQASFAIYNLGNAQFYPGFSTRAAYVLGLTHPL